MKFIGKLAKEWERVSQRFMKKLVGKWTILAYSSNRHLHSRGRILFVRREGKLTNSKDIIMKVIEPGQIDYFLFRRGIESFVVPVNEVIVSIKSPQVKGDTCIMVFSIIVGGI